MFHVGQHVVCIRDIPLLTNLKLERELGKKITPPIRGKVYTVRSVFTNRKGNKFCYLDEIILPLRSNGREPGINQRNFSPLKKLGVEDFTATKEPVPA